MCSYPQEASDFYERLMERYGENWETIIYEKVCRDDEFACKIVFDIFYDFSREEVQTQKTMNERDTQNPRPE